MKNSPNGPIYRKKPMREKKKNRGHPGPLPRTARVRVLGAGWDPQTLVATTLLLPGRRPRAALGRG
jgi:hypothetical protein